MPEATTLVQFTAKPPKMKTWRHSDGGSVSRRFDGHYTTFVEAPLILRDGDRVRMVAKDVAWCLATYPDNFHIVTDEDLDDEETESED